MPSRAVYDVFPQGDLWLIKMSGDSVTEVRMSKTAAVRRAQELAGGYDSGRVVVKTDSGAVEAEYVYGGEASSERR
jgi:hypothetical protein